MSGASLKIGFLRLADSAPVAVAHEFGYFADEGVESELFCEPSWANVADKLAYGFLDAAVITPPLAFALDLGLRGAPAPLVVPAAVSLGGNSVTLAREAAAEIDAIARHGRGLSTAQALAAWARRQSAPPALGVVHSYSTHHLLLRYWLASAGVEIGRDATLTVVPPASAVEALKAGRIAGFCAGAPWGEIAARAGVGAIVATSGDIWRNAPEKVFALRRGWAEASPAALAGATRALTRAALFCDAPENAPYVAALMSRARYADVDSHALMASLPGAARARGDAISFFRSAAAFPWRSHALWMLREMARWGLVDPGIDFGAAATRLYRPDLFRAAVAPLGVAVPLIDAKIEGAHAARWTLGGGLATAPIEMGPDLFCDGAVLDPAAYMKGAAKLIDS